MGSREGVFIGENNDTPTTPFNLKHMTVQTIFGTSASEFLFAPDDLGYTIKGEGGHDHIKGAEGNDILRGGSGDDWIEGFGGNDTIYGGQGNDVVFGDSGNDFIKGKSGSDQIYVSGGGRVAHALGVWVCSLGDALMMPKTGLCVIVKE